MMAGYSSQKKDPSDATKKEISRASGPGGCWNVIGYP